MSAAHAIERPELRYCIDALPAREELVFKSLVRMLEHRTHHSWRYSPGSSDLLVIGEGVDSLTLEARQPKPLQVLTLGTKASRRDWYLPLPLRASDLEAELNRMGAVLAAQVQREAVLRDTPSALPSTPAAVNTPLVSILDATNAPQAGQGLSEATAQAQPIDSVESHAKKSASEFSRDQIENKLIRLLRWPPSKLVASTTAVRLATLLTGQPISLAMLSARGKVSFEDCYAFLQALHRLDLLVYSDFPVAKPGFVERRASPRERALADSIIEPGAGFLPSRPPREAHTTPSLSLFERIRRRLVQGLGATPKSRA
jgi:hypothetical protein